ncbi:MAG: GNAT family N-acetyltransferase [Bacteroidota bacterium]
MESALPPTPTLKGPRIELVPAQEADRAFVFQAMAQSDITCRMMGPPAFPEIPVPSWEEFQEDYEAYFFSDEKPLEGRCFIIWWQNQPIGQINHNEIYTDIGQVELDIWLANSQFTGKGIGPEAVAVLCTYLTREFGCKRFIMAPSARNPEAVRAYEKAGFSPITYEPPHFIPDYHDTVILLKEC